TPDFRPIRSLGVDDAAEPDEIFEQGRWAAVKDDQTFPEPCMHGGVVSRETLLQRFGLRRRGSAFFGGGQFGETAISQGAITSHTPRGAGELNPRDIAIIRAVHAAAPALQDAFLDQTRGVELFANDED